MGVPRQHAKAYFQIGCPTAEDMQTSEQACVGNFTGSDGTVIGHTCECLFKLGLARHQTPTIYFPPVFEYVREKSCRPRDAKCEAGWPLGWNPKGNYTKHNAMIHAEK